MSAFVNELLRLVTRAFHSPECSIVMDALLRENRRYDSIILLGKNNE